jgi:hypothetical protein
MCRDPELDLKQRVRFSKKDQTLYMDVMLHLQEILARSTEERFIFIAKNITTEIFMILNKYKFKNFEHKIFVQDLNTWYKSTAA